MRPYKLSLATSQPAPVKTGSAAMGDFNDLLKTLWPVLLGGAAVNLFITYSKLLTGPLAMLWQIGGWISLGLGLYGGVMSGFNIDALGIKKAYGFKASRANYAYPNFYPYGSPQYYLHYESPWVQKHNNFGYVNIPRLANALAAKEAPILNTASYQLTSRNPIEDTNHVFSYIQDVY